MFEPLDVHDWDGHYDKPLTRESVYHVTWNGQIRICQNQEWDRFLYAAVMDPSARELAHRINICKHVFSFNNARGGSFCINEYGLVIVPIAGGNEYVPPKVVGRWTGTLQFWDGSGVFSLNDDANLSPGDPWPYPYLGMKYHLAANDYFYFRHETADGVNNLRAPQGNDAIRRTLRTIRGAGLISFVINNHGIVLVRRNATTDNSAVYVGRIDLNSWYPDPLRTKDISDSGIQQLIIALNRKDRRGWKDGSVFDKILAAYRANGKSLPDTAMRQSLIAIARNHHVI